MVAGEQLPRIRSRTGGLAVDAHFGVGRLGVHAELPGAGDSLQGEREVRVAVGLHLHRAHRAQVARADDLHRVIAELHLAVPWRQALVRPVEEDRRAVRSGGDGQARGSRGPEQVQAEREVLVGRHGELGGEVPPSGEAQDQLVLAGRHGRDERRAPALLAVDEDGGPAGFRVDRQRRVLRHRGQHEGELDVPALPRGDLLLLAQAAGELDGHGMRAGCELDQVRRHSGCPAVDEHTRSGGIGGHAQRGGPAGPLGQRDVHDDGPARLDVQLLLGDASVRGDDLDDVGSGTERHRDRGDPGVVVVDLHPCARLVGAEGRLHRPRGRIECHADERLVGRSELRWRPLVVARLDEVLEGPLVED